MRQITSFNQNWFFFKDTEDIHVKSGGEQVELPHTWNAEDGSDGGNDYFRGKCVYRKAFLLADLPKADLHYLEINGANASATIYLNGELLIHHDGGYSAFRVPLHDLKEKNELAVIVDNSPSDHVYPQMADFTFYGGLYRPVSLISVSETHFDLEYYGGSGIAVTPAVKSEDANIQIEVYVKNLTADHRIKYTIYNADGAVVAEKLTTETCVTLALPQVHLWNGIKDPYLYRAEALIINGLTVIDNVSTRFGCRTFEIDPKHGFILNGKSYPLRGISRHQDRSGLGNALSHCHHKEDIDLILDLGANTVRLAHYQHDRYFYDLCDETGLVVWAEIPYISKHLPGATENAVSQLKELIVQNYNHPSIVVWGLSNEITIGGTGEDGGKALYDTHVLLHSVAHAFDKTRKTVLAAVSMCPTDHPYLTIPDAIAYNHYFGWYGGEVAQNGPWFDKFHEEHPSIPIGISEYGAEALNWHTSKPTQGDYTEEYQAYYHEEMIKQLFTRPYIWATYVWNMFDFGADARAEGGEAGQNHKGLVTMDRRYKKDAYYAYKAWLSDKPFVHICGKRYVDRVEDPTTVTVYSNLPEIELFANGVSLGKKTAPDHFFRFEVPNKGETCLTAEAGSHADGSVICKVDRPNEDYILKDTAALLNWFDVTEKEGYLSLNDKVSDILATEGGQKLFNSLWQQILPKDNNAAMAGFELTDAMHDMMHSFTLLRLLSMMGMMNVKLTKEQLLSINEQLNKISK